MSGSVRKCSSKWDLRNDTPFEDLNVANDSWPGKGGRSFHQKEPRHVWQSPDLAGNDGSRLYAVETNDIRSKHDSGFPSRENISGSRGSHSSENDDKDTNRYDMDFSWDRGGSYDSRMSPGLEELRQQNRSHSPRAGWSRPLRGRSRSRSWSRSKSPVLGFRWDSGFVDRSRSRSGVSPQLCRDFVSGKCRRGDQCHFLHKGIQTSEDNWDGRHRKGGSSYYSTSHDTRDYPSSNVRPTTYCTDFFKGKCRRGASCRFGHHGAADGFVNDFSREEENERRKRDSSIDREPHRNNNIPCKFFAAGNCRYGRYCRFSHNNLESTSPDRKSQDERRDPGQKSNYSNQVLGGPKWSDPIILPNTTKLIENKNENIRASEPGSTAWSKNNNGFRNTLDSENKTCIGPAVSREAAICNDGESLGWKVDNAGAGMVPSESTHNEKWLGDVNMSPDWNFSIKSSKCIMKEENSRNTLDPESLSLNNASLTTCEESITHRAVASSHDDKTAVEKIVLNANLNISPNIMSNESFDQTDHQSGAFPPHVNAIGQNPAVIPTELQRGFLKIPEIKILPSEGKAVNGQDVQEVITSIVNTGIPPTQKIVTSEQLNQLTNFSSSLAQLLGNERLYSALIPNDLRGTSFAKSEVSIQPNPVTTESQKHYDPMSDSVESKKPENSGNPQSVLQNAIVQTCVSVGKSVTEPKDLMASFFPGVPRSADHHQSGNLTEKCSCESLIEQKARCEVGRENERGIEENNKAQEESEKLQDNGPLESKEGPDDGKKGKDAKVIRSFKFALAEFVKELLKPTWKEGQINKDAYKTIVKKVVDKVTCTLQGANLPHTQEKIDHYLSSSKPKLMKLVQAYVGKAQQNG